MATHVSALYLIFSPEGNNPLKAHDILGLGETKK